MIPNPSVFRANDIRGIADTDLTSEFVTLLGRAYGSHVLAQGGTQVCVGRDCRLHGPRIRDALIDGILQTGLNVIDVGVVPSPLLYFAVFHLDTDGGVQITGSHNPKEFNGFKMMLGKSSLHGENITRLRERIERRDFLVGEGTLTEQSIDEDYAHLAAENLHVGPRKLKVVVDGGNGAGGPTAMAVLKALHVETIPLYVEMDGSFPNHHPDPTVVENLQELIATVKATGADLGVGYDGDGDRLGIVDETGEIIWGDRLMILLSRDLLRECPGSSIVAEVKCSKTLFEDIAKHGGRPIMSAVGHSLIKARMVKEDAMLGGEMSGHIFFKHRWYGFDDAVYATCRLLEILGRDDRTLSEHLADVPKTHVTPEIRLDCPDDIKFGVVKEAQDHYRATHRVVEIDGARIDFEGGWGLIRASNTQPVIVLRAEGASAEARDAIRDELTAFVDARVRP